MPADLYTESLLAIYSILEIIDHRLDLRAIVRPRPKLSGSAVLGLGLGVHHPLATYGRAHAVLAQRPSLAGHIRLRASRA